MRRSLQHVDQGFTSLFTLEAPEILGCNHYDFVPPMDRHMLWTLAAYTAH